MLPNGKALAFGASLRWFDSTHPSLIKTEIEITTHEESLKILIETPPNIDYEEYWERVNKISEKSIFLSNLLYKKKEYQKQFIHDLNDSELMNLGLNSIQFLLSKDWNSSEDDVFNDI